MLSNACWPRPALSLSGRRPTATPRARLPLARRPAWSADGLEPIEELVVRTANSDLDPDLKGAMLRSLVHFFAESQRERAESQREHAECQRAEKERERAEKEKAQLLPRGARDAGRNHHRLLLVWRDAAEVGRPALSARVAAIMTAAS